MKPSTKSPMAKGPKDPDALGSSRDILTNWLVVYLLLWKNEFVNSDDYSIIPNIWKNRTCSKPPTVNNWSIHSDIEDSEHLWYPLVNCIVMEHHHVKWENSLCNYMGNVQVRKLWFYQGIPHESCSSHGQKPCPHLHPIFGGARPISGPFWCERHGLGAEMIRLCSHWLVFRLKNYCCISSLFLNHDADWCRLNMIKLFWHTGHYVFITRISWLCECTFSESPWCVVFPRSLWVTVPFMVVHLRFSVVKLCQISTGAVKPAC